MKSTIFQPFIKGLAQLTAYQKQPLSNELHNSTQYNATVDFVESYLQACPYC